MDEKKLSPPASHYDVDPYGYAMARSSDLQELMIARNLLGVRGSMNKLPEDCFKEVEVAIAENDEDDPYPLDADKEARVYLTSNCYFLNFVRKFGDLLDNIKCPSLINGAKYSGSRIICKQDRYNETGNYAKENSLEFTPTVEVGFWPDEGIEWYMRRRKKIRDKRTGHVYTWPDPEDVSCAQKVGCNLVPYGHVVPKRTVAGGREKSTEFDLEWAVAFTKIEALIARSLNHPKTRCFLFMCLLHKAFMDDADFITPEHIRHHFYSMVENSPLGWVDEQLGARLVQMIRELKTRLQKERLPHYFLHNHDVFAALPKSKLKRAHEKFFRIDEQLVPHLMVALKRLRAERTFYPMPDMDKLYTILTTDMLLSVINPDLALTNVGGANAFERARQENEARRKAKDPSQERMRRFHQKRLEEKEAALKARQEQSGETETIDMKFKVDRFDGARGRLVIEYFITHFVAMAKKSNEFRAYGQGRAYRLQAENLMRLLKDLNFEGTQRHMSLRTEIEQLKQVSRGDSRDYWNINWGGKRANSFRNGSGGLPAVPPAAAAASQIPGTERRTSDNSSEASSRFRVMADVH